MEKRPRLAAAISPPELPPHNQDYGARPWRSNETFMNPLGIRFQFEAEIREKFLLQCVSRAAFRPVRSMFRNFAAQRDTSKTRRASPAGFTKSPNSRYFHGLLRPVPSSQCGFASNTGFITQPPMIGTTQSPTIMNTSLDLSSRCSL